MKILYKSIRIKNKKYNEKLNKAMHKFVRVLDKYGWGEEDMYVPSLRVFGSIWKYRMQWFSRQTCTVRGECRRHELLGVSGGMPPAGNL